MPHVYFHCANSERVYMDPQGVDVEDLTEAHQRATSVIHQLINSHNLENWRVWTLHVSDEDGEEIFLMPFSYVVGKPH